MDINALISQYGYAALVVGCLAEGETLALLGGVTAHQGLLHFPLVVLAVAAGGIMGDQVLFLIGRHYGSRLLQRFTKQQKNIARTSSLIRRYPKLFVIGCRFMYGFRIIGPLMIGTSRLSPALFIPLNILGAVIWALIFTSLGYAGGELVAPWLHSLDQHLKHFIWLIIAVVVVIIWRIWMKPR